MASKKENLKALFSNTRSRAIILLTALFLIIAVVVGVLKFTSLVKPSSNANADLTVVPGNIQSIPGATNQTAQYASLQEKQNVDQAQQATQTGGSAIPTIIRTHNFGEGVEIIGPKPGEGGVGFETLARQNEAGPQQSLWLQALKDTHCSKKTVANVVNQGAAISDLKAVCSCMQLKDNGYKLSELEPVCSCKELKASGFNARQMKDIGYTAERLRQCGFNACELKGAGFNAQEMKDGGFSDGEMKGAGFSDDDIVRANGLPDGVTADDVRKAGCQVGALIKLRRAGVSAAVIRNISGCSAAQLKAAGFSALDLKNAGFSAAELKKAGFTPAQLKAAGFSAKDLLQAGFSPADLSAAGFTPDQIKDAEAALPLGAQAQVADCSPASLKAAHAKGISAATIKETLGCSASDLRAGGYSAAELRKAGFTAAELKDAGFTPAELKTAGFSAKELKAAGFSALQLKEAGFTPEQLKAAGFNADDLKKAGFTAAELSKAGFSLQELAAAGFMPQATTVEQLPDMTQPVSSTTLPPVGGAGMSRAEAAEAANAKQLQDILKRQQTVMADQRNQQLIQQRTGAMLGAATQALQDWKSPPMQVYVGGQEKEEGGAIAGAQTGPEGVNVNQTMVGVNSPPNTPAVIKAGDVLFAVLDTSINSDEPGPILATIVSGKLKGSKLIGSFVLPNNADKLVINFNVMSVPGISKTTTINAYAIDENTARTALSTRANHHYLLRYGSLFAATFLEGFGNAFQSANTTITVGGSGGAVQNTTITNGVGRSILENAVIGLATLGKSWGQVAQQQFNTPTTVEVCSGTPLGVLFTQDLQSL